MKLEEFQRLPTEKVAQLVREAGPKVCVFPINGTRRWFMLEHDAGEDFVGEYIYLVGRRQVELYKMFFDHGIDTLLTPIFGPDILERDRDYEEFITRGLTWCAENEDVLEFYEDYDVRVRVYGDAQRHLQDTPYTHALDAFDRIVQNTSTHQSYRLFFGVCAHDATETVGEIAIRYYQEYGRAPNKQQIVKAYYGEYVEPVDFFIGFGQFAAFDMPLIATGNEDLYFTIAPSPYLDAQTLRAILYDHLYTREKEPNYTEMAKEDLITLRNFYRINRNIVLGIGIQSTKGGIWLPQIVSGVPEDQHNLFHGEL